MIEVKVFEAETNIMQRLTELILPSNLKANNAEELVYKL